MLMGLKDKQTTKNKNFIQSFIHAMQGIFSLVTTERNFRKHLLFGMLAVVLGLILNLNLGQWLWIILAIFSVISSEALALSMTIWQKRRRTLLRVVSYFRRHLHLLLVSSFLYQN